MIRRFKIILFALLFCMQLPAIKLIAEDAKKANIKLIFNEADSIKTCKAVVTSDNAPVKGVEVHFYVKRLYSLLPIGKVVETDENGEAATEFPGDLPGDKNGNYIAIAKIEEDDNYGSAETQSEVKWGTHSGEGEDNWGNRSLSASREKAPMYLIVVSNLIISVIWGTILYVIFQIYRIKKESKVYKKEN